MGNADRMQMIPALEALAAWRSDQIVVTTMGATREWSKLSQHPLDFHYLPSAMGHAPMVGLGLAIAQPQREVIAFNGDGCMLMSLGCLVTVVASGVKNYTLIVIDNSRYEVTGGQDTAAANTPADFAAFAKAAGFTTVASFSDPADWQQRGQSILTQPGPRFIALKVAPIGAEYQLPTLDPIRQRIERFQESLAIPR